MTRMIVNRKLRTFCLGAFVAIFPCIVVPTASAQQGSTGDLSVVGHVGVEAVTASTGDIVASGSLVETYDSDSRALISLGRLGRVEIKGDTQMRLFYSESDRIITIHLFAGSVWVNANPRVTATIERR